MIRKLRRLVRVREQQKDLALGQNNKISAHLNNLEREKTAHSENLYNNPIRLTSVHQLESDIGILKSLQNQIILGQQQLEKAKEALTKAQISEERANRLFEKSYNQKLADNRKQEQKEQDDRKYTIK